MEVIIQVMKKVAKNLHYFMFWGIITYDFIFIMKFMDKKEYLLDMLVQLEPIRDLAKWLRILVEQWNLWDDTLDTLINAVQWAIVNSKCEING